MEIFPSLNSVILVFTALKTATLNKNLCGFKLLGRLFIQNRRAYTVQEQYFTT